MEGDARQSRSYDVQVAANGEVQLDVAGNFYSVISTDQTNFEIGYNSGATSFAKKGTKRRLPDGVEFQSLRIRNTNGSALNITIEVGFGDFVDGDVSLSGTVTVDNSDTLSSAADVSITAASTVQVAAANTSRREILISNLAANTQTMRIGDSNAGAARGVELAPGQSVTLTTTAAVYAYNPGGAAESLGVVEVED